MFPRSPSIVDHFLQEPRPFRRLEAIEVRLEGVVKGRRLTSASGGCGPSCRLGGMGNEGVGVAGLEGVMDENRGIGLDPLQLGQSAGVQIDSDTDRECSLGSTPQQLAATIKAERAKWVKVIKQAGIKRDG